MLKFVAVAFTLLIAASGAAEQPRFAPEQQEVWRMEEKYWQIFTALDREGYLALWDENQVDWPYPLSDPIRKDFIRSDPFALLQGGKLKNVHLEPKAVQVFNNVGVTYYIVTDTYTKKDGSSEEESFRISHTWRKKDGTWLIIAGMSAPEQPAK